MEALIKHSEKRFSYVQLIYEHFCKTATLTVAKLQWKIFSLKHPVYTKITHTLVGLLFVVVHCLEHTFHEETLLSM